MMKQLILDQTIIRYQISYKKNKNTYFHFKKEGYIQVNAARGQTQKKIVAFMMANKVVFLKKYNRMTVVPTEKTHYQLFSKSYKIERSTSENRIRFDQELMVVYEPEIELIQVKKQYKKIEKEALFDELNKIIEKHKFNGLVDYSNVQFKTRYTTTRFGSCNPRKRTINFNLHLANYEEKYLEYVFLHEICHLVHFNHSKSFYGLLVKLCPNYKIIKRELNNIFKR